MTDEVFVQKWDPPCSRCNEPTCPAGAGGLVGTGGLGSGGVSGAADSETVGATSSSSCGASHSASAAATTTAPTTIGTRRDPPSDGWLPVTCSPRVRPSPRPPRG